MDDVVDIKEYASRRLLASAKSKMRALGFTDREMGSDTTISTSDPRLQRLVADALMFKKVWN